MRASGRKLVALSGVIALVLTACGARLTADQRAAGIGLTGAGGPGVFSSTGPNGTVPGGTGPGGVTPSTGGSIGPGGVTSAQPSAPPGGNGGATDVGVTASKLTIATIADVSGVQPGLFRSAWQAMQAAVAMQNSQGGIDGRLLDLKLLDSKVDSGSTRKAVLDACNSSFAIVGSMSAFDDGGASAVDQCKIPDMTAITTSQARLDAKYSFPTYPNQTRVFVRGSAEYMRAHFKDATDHAAQLWLNTSTTRNNALAKRTAYESTGFKFIYKAETQVVESNYTPYVQKMKDAGVQFVTMLSDWQSIARLTDAMRKEKWKPKVLEWDSVVYTPQFLDETKGAAEGSFVYLNTALLEEVSKNPEMQLYEQWLARVAPGARPDYFGLYAWSSGRLFMREIKKIGPKITRDKLIADLKSLHSWDGNGLHASHDIGANLPSRCTMYARIVNNKFTRYEPSSGFNCSGQLYRES